MSGCRTGGNHLDDIVGVALSVDSSLGSGSLDDLDIAGGVEAVEAIGEVGIVEHAVGVVGDGVGS